MRGSKKVIFTGSSKVLLTLNDCNRIKSKSVRREVLIDKNIARLLCVCYRRRLGDCNSESIR